MNDDLPKNRPYTILNAAMSVDGKISTIAGNAEFSSKEDWRRVHELRSSVDAIMVGINTILKDDPKLHIKYYTPKRFWRIIVDSNAKTPLYAKLFDMDLNIYPILIATSKNATPSKIESLSEKGAHIFQTESTGWVNLNHLMEYLFKLNINRILLEGGGTLNFSMLKNQLVDEVIIAIAPVIVGGKDAITLVEGIGFQLVENGIHLDFQRMELYGNNIVLFFKIS
ncbi:MAG: 2,5-diamino-6-(ribosylamino)-4(3H)-pyrimidinone 5'-phosphate reductase [Candidatus Helarchaeota archaeon]